MLKHVVVIIAFMTIPVLGQLPGDLNCDEIAYTTSDIIWYNNFMNDCFTDSMPDCTNENGDLDNDGISLTVADFYILTYVVLNGPPYQPVNFPNHALLDTLMIESASANPGDNLSVPIYLKTYDILTAFQLCIASDSQLITIDSLVPDEAVSSIQHNCFGLNHMISFNFSDINDSILFTPGDYQVAELFFTVNPDITDPLIADIEFTEYPPHAYYTGLANIEFFQPVLVNAEITITPTGIEHDEANNLPFGTYIETYPNPFNSSVNIIVASQLQSRLIIYDLLGRLVKVFPIDSGTTHLVWNADDNDNQPLGTGIYFTRIENDSKVQIQKLVYLK